MVGTPIGLGYHTLVQHASHLSTLNPAQQRAVDFGMAAEGAVEPGPPLLVIAGAGTGKTKTLAHRVAGLIARGADPRRILLLTFTRRAAAEMIRRVEGITAEVADVRYEVGQAIEWAGTFHAMGAKLLRLHAEQIGLDPAFTILDRGDAADLLNLVRNDLGLARKARRFPKKETCLGIYSHAVNARAELAPVLARQFPWCSEWQDELKALFRAYVVAKQRESVLDYDDLLLYWARMMEETAIAAEVAGRFDFVLVDEYQDTNALQAGTLQRLKPDGRGLTVVGDDAQAIFGFRAATARNILDFPGQFTPAAAVVTLERNYRSTQPILDAANAVMALAPEGFAKRLVSERPSAQLPFLALVRDEADQALHVVERILANREAGTDLCQQAVLFRTAHHSGPLEIELGRRNIPYVKYGGLKFLETAHVKDLLAFLRLAENPRDRIAAFRVLQLLPGIGPATAQKAQAALAAADFGFAGLEHFRPPAAAAERWPDLVALLTDLGREPGWPGQVERVRRFYDPLLEEIHDHARARLADLGQLQAIAAGHPSRERFLTEVTLDPPVASSDEAGTPHLDEDFLVLSTIHSAKGREWRAVFLLNVVDGCIPSDMAAGSSEEIDEERRLLYVAMTRARDELHLLQPLRFYSHGQSRHGDRYMHALRTRFIPGSLLGLFDRHTRGRPAAGIDASAANGPKADIGAAMLEMWA
jgi:DNA helicase-2/ATP-dependent DNA helicase PcrA